MKVLWNIFVFLLAAFWVLCLWEYSSRPGRDEFGRDPGCDDDGGDCGD